MRRIDVDPTTVWREFLERFTPLIFEVIDRLVERHDQRMDLFVYVLERLEANRMRRIRAYRSGSDDERSFRAYLAVVSRNLALDALRAGHGRYRPFTSLGGLDVTKRLVFEYHVRGRLPLEQVRQLLEKRHGIRLGTAALAGRVTEIERSLSTSQRWSLLAQLAACREAHPIDPTRDAVRIADRTIPIRSPGRDPEARMVESRACGAVREALETVEPHKRTALTLRFRFGLPVRACARAMGATNGQVDHWVREAMGDIREHLRRNRIVRGDLDAHQLDGIWRC